jgi:betaine lipid synthase
LFDRGGTHRVFLWNALGVPINQANLFLAETTTEQYAIDTLDPIAVNTRVATENYHYALCLQQRYTTECSPLYLTRSGFEALKEANGKVLNGFRLHTDSVVKVLRQLEPSSLSVWVGMDHSPSRFPPVDQVES